MLPHPEQLSPSPKLALKDNLPNNNILPKQVQIKSRSKKIIKRKRSF